LARSSEGDSLDSLRSDVLEYLAAHPEAADSVEGILGWWLPKQRYEKAKTKLQRVLESLAAEGLVERIQLVNGKVVYKGLPKKVAGPHK
jgi:Fe2+ or Zn2+ uptake regulation protein